MNNDQLPTVPSQFATYSSVETNPSFIEHTQKRQLFAIIRTIAAVLAIGSLFIAANLDTHGDHLLLDFLIAGMIALVAGGFNFMKSCAEKDLQNSITAHYDAIATNIIQTIQQATNPQSYWTWRRPSSWDKGYVLLTANIVVLLNFRTNRMLYVPKECLSDIQFSRSLVSSFSESQTTGATVGAGGNILIASSYANTATTTAHVYANNVDVFTTIPAYEHICIECGGEENFAKDLYGKLLNVKNG